MSQEFPKYTIQAHADIAFVKYWGRKDDTLRLPENGSISMKLSGLYSTTTIQLQPQLDQDIVEIDGQTDQGEFKRTVAHLERIRTLAKAQNTPNAHLRARVVSQNSFPASTGLSSSGSGFAALTLAGTTAYGLNLSEREVSILARQGSGSAARAVCGGFVEWHDGDTSETSFAETIFPAEHWQLVDCVAIVDDSAKTLSTSEAHESATTSIVFEPRQLHIRQKIQSVKQAIAARDFKQLGELVEAEALEFHALLMTSEPSYIALRPGSIAVMNAVQSWRAERVPCYFTLNTGHNVHVITLLEYEEQVLQNLYSLPDVKNVISSSVAAAPTQTQQHLF